MDKKDGGTIARLALAEHDAPDECFCDRTKLGAPGVSCGDCPTRDYAPNPAPTADGADELEQAELWVANHCHEPAMEKTLFSAIAALRQPVPDAVREEVVGAIAKPATGWDVAGNYGDGKWRAFRLEKQQTYLGDPKSSEMEAIAETHRLAASFSQQESRND